MNPVCFHIKKGCDLHVHLILFESFKRSVILFRQYSSVIFGMPLVLVPIVNYQPNFLTIQYDNHLIFVVAL